MATTEQAQEVSAGRELDALIAVSIMGWGWYATVVTLGGFEMKGDYFASPKDVARWERAGWTCTPIDGRAPTDHDSVPRYSTDRAAALDVVDKLQALGLYVAINTTCDAGLYDVEVMDGTDFQSLGCAVFKPLAHGICLAAREAVKRMNQSERETKGEEERGYPSFSDGGMPLG